MTLNLSVFFPAYNEEENIEKTVKDALKVLKDLKLENYEVIVVNDGSKDKTGEVVASLEKEDKHVRLVNHPQNKGYGEALKTGFKEAKYEWVAFADSDGQFDFGEISKFLDETDEVDVIVGYRLTRADPFMRKVYTYGWKMIALVFLGLTVKDYSCGFKLIKKQVFNGVQPLLAGEKVTQIEFLVKAKRLGFKFAEVGVHHYPRKFGTQTGANLSVVAKSIIDLIKLWWMLLSKKEFFAILAILGLAAFLRFYRLSEYMTFLGDEGRDALMIKRILTTGDLPLLGPATSIGNMYLGPLYYYMMSIPMAIWWLNPVAAAGMVALIGTLTVWLVYFLGKNWFGSLAGLSTAFLYAISPINIIYSRSSWNPNPAPFFALLSIFGLYKVHQTGNFLWLILTAVALAFAVQMHYLALILVLIVAILYLYELWKAPQKENIIKGTILSLAAFLFLMSPLVIFDLKHDFMNYHAISTFFGNRETTVNLNPLNTASRVIPIYNHNLIGRYITQDLPILTPLVSLLILVPLVVIRGWPTLALGVWLLVGIFGLALYKQNIYDHYLGFLNPALFILLGGLMVFKQKWVVYGAAILVLVLVVVNLQNIPIKNPPNNQLVRTQEIAKYIISETGEKPFNFALIAKSNYDDAYQFYLYKYGHKPKQVPFDITDQLFVVCEDSECNPVVNPKQEISHFGMTKVEWEKEFQGVKIYKLIHNESGVKP